MKDTIIALLLLAFSATSLAEDNKRFKIQVAIDQNDVQAIEVDAQNHGMKEIKLTDEVRMVIEVNPNARTNLQTRVYSNGALLHSALQTQNNQSGSNFYLICSNKLVRFISPLASKAPSCPAPSA